jgi:hypothetical protein
MIKILLLCCIFLSACAHSPDNAWTLERRAVFYIPETTRTFQLSFTRNAEIFGLFETLLISKVQIAPILEKLLLDGALKTQFTRVEMANNFLKNNDQFLVQFELKNYQCDEHYQVNLALSISVSLQEEILYRRLYYAQNHSLHLAEFLKAPYYGRENALMEATEHALQDVLKQFEKDFQHARRLLGLPIRQFGTH